ncbi:hypothetical protein WJX81_006840 [Elliptochloris bilobata]|uniref:DNA mismatch repair proteins mutS family domain-containing protein n=1 Tax=Elliptochloris bilobata TaxID=381761 RepID=A0AAW1SL36_9CHLO
MSLSKKPLKSSYNQRSAVSLVTPEQSAPEPAAKAQGTSAKRQKLCQLLDGGDRQSEQFRKVESRFSWLEDKNTPDGRGRRKGDPNFDERTVTVPEQFYKQLSASQQQYWAIKKKYRDVILFFKVGKFYELYADDAQIGHDVLNWKLTVTGVGHCLQVGCPESGIDEAVARLVAAGYKVARVEQMESAAEAKAARGGKATIRRELTRVHTPAIATDNIGSDAVHLLALHEEEQPAQWAAGAAAAKFSFAFLDAAAGRFYVGAVHDDAGRANLSALLTQVAPREVLFARGGLSAATARCLASPPVPLQLSPVEPGAEFPDPVDMGAYEEGAQMQARLGHLRLPAEVCAAGAASLAALAALRRHLMRLHADDELASSAHVVAPYSAYAGALRLDGPTLANLELLENSCGTAEGSLMACLDTCASPGGRRLLRRWLCRPLRDLGGIAARQDAVAELAKRPGLAGPLRAGLRHLGDLERALGQARNASAQPAAGLPGWAVDAAQRRRLAAVGAVSVAAREAAALLATLAKGGDDYAGRGPAEGGLLAAAAAAAPGSDSAPMAALGAIDAALDWVAPNAKGGKGKAKKGGGARVVKLRAAAWEAHVQPRTGGGEEDEEAAQRAAEVACTTDLLARLHAYRDAWERLEAALSTVDVLAAFAEFGATANGPTCRAELLPAGVAGGSVMDLEALWHPCARAGSGGAVVPNDLRLGTSAHPERALLLTGPNMGGKSTLLRAACVAVVLAQMGCPVPAASAKLTVTDQIFTRLGAQDRILSGESTFMVECSEAAAILRHATASSLVVLDELGRGTSTFDGYAIAYAVLKHLSAALDARLLFATHYFGLTAEFAGDVRVANGHMAALVGGGAHGERGDHSTAGGPSYGLQVARLAGIPASVVASASEAGARIETKLQGVFAGRASQPLAAPEIRLLHALGGAAAGSRIVQLWHEARRVIGA